MFGELFRAAEFRREDAIVSEKLWWEFWPRESAADELDASLGRLRFDHVDLIYCTTLPAELSVEQAVAEVAALLAAAAQGIEPPCAAQMAYSLLSRAEAEGLQMTAALRRAGAGPVASAALEGGLLTGKYDSPAATGRLAGGHDDPARRAALDTARALRTLAAEWGTSAAALAVAFVLDPPALASVLVGAPAPAQLDEVVAGVALHAELSDDDRARLRGLAG